MAVKQQIQKSSWPEFINATRYGLEGAGHVSGILGGVQIGMLEHRNSLPINYKIGTYPKFKLGYGKVGLATRALGRAGTAGSIVGTIVDYNTMRSGEMSPGRFGYKLTGTVSSIAGGMLIGAELGGPYGALGGTSIGLIYVGGEMAYDGVVWFGTELGRAIVQTENALKSGWYPGR